ncbi:MAG: MFS transporter [Acidimicrobiia bacterium]|nr:MFS transporter [Acidimicrobiia bacterium]
MNSRRRLVRLIFLSVLVVTASTQPVFLLGAGFLTISDDLGFGATGLGVLTAAFFLTAGVASAPMGRLVQRIGWRRAIYINMAGAGTMLFLIGSMANNLWVFGLLLVVAGVVYGFANPAVNQALADHVDPQHRALVFGLKHAGIPASTLLAGLAVPLVIVDVGWRPAYFIAISLVVVVLLLVPRDLKQQVTPVHSSDTRRAVAPMQTRLLLTLGLGASLATWAAVALGSYMVAAAVDAGFSEKAGGVLLFIGSAFSLSARATAGYITDRFGGRGFGGISLLAGIGALVFVLMALSTGWTFALLVPIAFATGWGWPGLMTFTVVNANTSSAAASSSITQAGVFLGAGGGPVVVGWLVDTWSFSVAFVVVGVMLAAASLVVGWVGRQARSVAII